MTESSLPPARLLYDREAAAYMLSTSARRIDELRRGGKLPSVKDGRESKFTHEDLEFYVKTLPASEMPRHQA